MRPTNGPLRILYWTEVFHPYTGGTELLGETLLAGLGDRGHRLFVVTDRGERDLADEDVHRGIPLCRFDFRNAVVRSEPDRLAAVARRAEEAIRSFDPDVVHVNAVGPSLFFLLRMMRRREIPWILTPHAPLTDQSAGDATILGRALRSADRVVSLSRAQRESIERIVPEVRKRSVVIHCGLDAPDIVPGPLPFDPPHLLSFGRHVRDKGFDLALEAFSRIAERFPEVDYTVVGDGAERGSLERLADELGIGERVGFPGRVPEIPPYLDAATAVVMPSRWEETFGLVALEAALMGRPVVATRVGALPEVVVGGETGLVVEPEDPRTLAEAVARLLEAPDETRRMGRAARRRALETFGLDRSVAEYETLYRDLVRE